MFKRLLGHLSGRFIRRFIGLGLISAARFTASPDANLKFSSSGRFGLTSANDTYSVLSQFLAGYSFLSRFFAHSRQFWKTMKEYDDGRNYIQEFWRLTISSQITMLDAMANTLDSFPKEMQMSWLREMYKSNAAIFNLYLRTIEQAGAQSIAVQSDALRRCSEALQTVLSKMQETGTPPESEAKSS